MPTRWRSHQAPGNRTSRDVPPLISVYLKFRHWKIKKVQCEKFPSYLTHGAINPPPSSRLETASTAPAKDKCHFFIYLYLKFSCKQAKGGLNLCNFHIPLTSEKPLWVNSPPTAFTSAFSSGRKVLLRWLAAIWKGEKKKQGLFKRRRYNRMSSSEDGWSGDRMTNQTWPERPPQNRPHSPHH